MVTSLRTRSTIGSTSGRIGVGTRAANSLETPSPDALDWIVAGETAAAPRSAGGTTNAGSQARRVGCFGRRDVRCLEVMVCLLPCGWGGDFLNQP